MGLREFQRRVDGLTYGINDYVVLMLFECHISFIVSYGSSAILVIIKRAYFQSYCCLI